AGADRDLQIGRGIGQEDVAGRADRTGGGEGLTGRKAEQAGTGITPRTERGDGVRRVQGGAADRAAGQGGGGDGPGFEDLPARDQGRGAGRADAAVRRRDDNRRGNGEPDLI